MGVISDCPDLPRQRPGHLRRKLLCGTVPFLLGLSPALAQDPPPQEEAPQEEAPAGETTVLGTIVLQTKLAYSGAITGYLAGATETGIKAGVPLSEVPQSISVVTSTELEARQPRQIEDAIKYTAGINASTWGVDDRYDQFSIRGFDLGSGSIYRDGLPQKSLNFAGFSTDPYMIERIDVLRGPAGVLYGANDAGGMINLVTKRPVFERLAEGRLGYDSNGTGSVAFDWSDGIDAGGAWAARFTGLLRGGETEQIDSDNDRGFLAASVTWSPSDFTALTLLAHIQRDRLTPINMFPVYGEDIDPAWGWQLPSDWAYRASDYNFFKTSQQSVGWDFTHDFSDTLSFSQRARYARQDTDYAQLDYSSVSAAGPSYYAFHNDETAQTFSIDNNLSWKSRFAGGENTLVVGYDHARRSYRVRQNLDYTMYTVDPANPNFDFGVAEPALSSFSETGYVEQGLYLQDHLKLDQGTTVTLGLRHSRFKSTSDDLLTGTGSSQKDNATTHMIGVTHDLGNGFTPYASYTEGFIQNIGKTINDELLSPSRNKQYELGLRYQPHDELLLSLAVFDLTKTNVKDYDLNDPTWGSFTQAGKVNSRGFELEARGRISDVLQGMASYSYLETEVIKTPGAQATNAAMAPRHQISFWLDYDAAALLPGLSIGAGMRYVSDAYSTQENLRVTPGYSIADLSLRYEAEGYAVDLGVTNLFDKDYYGVCYDNYGCAMGEGRVVQLSLNKTF